LPEASKGPLLVKRAALRHTGLPADIATSARVQLTDRYMPLFTGTGGGFSVPLVASGELLGMLNCEYPLRPAVELAKKDEAAIIPLCNQLSVALRNLRLLHRARSYEGHLRRMIDAANALVVVVDRDQRLTIVNQPMEQASGYVAGGDLPGLLRKALGDRPGSEAADSRPVYGKNGEAEPHLAALLQRALAGQDAEGVEVLLGSAGKPPTRAVFNVTALRDATGAIDGAAAMGQNLEQVRSLERQVLQAERLATLGQLAAGVVHELNNPLSAIAIYGDYLARRLEQAGEDFRGDAEKARRICEGAERIQKLTRDLMSYGRPTGERERVALDEVVTQALSLCDPLLRTSGVPVQVSHHEGLPPIHGVRRQLQQVVVNLLTNACHALSGEERHNAIRIETTTATLDGQPAVALLVSDTGSGIAETHRARVFEPFFSTKAEGLGTGLGLPIVKNIVDAHGGRVGFETQSGVGTTFKVVFPVGPLGPAGPAPLTAAGARRRGGRAEAKGRAQTKRGALRARRE
jgi:signal transduction histidine kinase